MIKPKSAWWMCVTLLAGLLCGCATLSPHEAARETWESADLNPVTHLQPPRHEPIVLTSPGVPVTIVKPEGLSRDAADAMGVLAYVLERATGSKPTLSASAGTGPSIVLGDSAEAAAIGLVGRNLSPEGFAIKTTVNRVYIVGNSGGELPVMASPNRSHDGLAWGIYDFAERFVGARFYFPGEAGVTVPHIERVVVPPVWIQDAPTFAVREIWPSVSDSYHGSGTNLHPLHLALRSGGWWPNTPAIHQPVWGKSEYAQSRPEIFQQTSDGGRDFGMLCYGNPLTPTTFLEELQAHFAHTAGKHAGATFVRGNTITVSPWDAEIACYCPDCRKLWNPAGGQYGSASNVIGQFTLTLASAVKQKWPDKTVLVVPYLNYAAAPPGITFPGNVEAEVCGMPGLAMYKEPTVAASEQANIDAWIKATGRPVQNWHYSCWPEDRTAAAYLFPHVIQKFYLDNRNKTVGTFINGVTDHWPRQALSLYIWMKCLWHPEYNVDAGIDAFCSDLFGPAGATMRKLVGLQIDGWEKSRWPGGAMSIGNIYTISYPPAMIAKMKSLLARAHAEAHGDALVEQRLAYYSPALEAMFTEAASAAKGPSKTLDAQKVGEDPAIDGRLDDAVWARANPASFVLAYDAQNPEPKYPTTVKAVWTQRGVTFGFHMSEPTPQSLEKKRLSRDHSTMWWDDNIEAILDVTGKGQGAFYHLMFSAADQIYDAKGGGHASFTADKIKHAIYVGKDFWSVEVFIPWSQFPEAAVPGSGTRTQWLGNFTRHRVADCGLDAAAPRHGSVAEYQRLNTTFAKPSINLSDLVPFRFVE